MAKAKMQPEKPRARKTNHVRPMAGRTRMKASGTVFLGGATAARRATSAKARKIMADTAAHIVVDGVELTRGEGLKSPVVRTMFVVVSRQDLPAVVDGARVVRHRVTLDAVYEAEPIHHGLATIQGNRDNRAFGLGQPEARIDMVFESKAIADVFLAGRAFHVDFTDVD